jgi:hypothetical protein
VFKEDAVAYRAPAETQKLIHSLFQQEVIEAQRMSPEEKFFAGPQLFEAACRITLAGIRNQFPDAPEERCLEILRERLELQRRLEGQSDS